MASSLDRPQLSDIDAPLVADICRKLDGVDLAIELAAARVYAFGTRGVAERLNDRLWLLTGGLFQPPDGFYRPPAAALPGILGRNGN